MNRLPHLAQRMFNVPVAIAPAKAEVIIAALADRLGVAHMFRANGEAATLVPVAYDDDGEVLFSTRDHERGDKGYDTVEGVAVIQVCGTLVQKNGYLRPSSGMTGYDGIRQNFLTALYDPAVKAIAFDIDSPGGEVAGCFDLADEIFRARGVKPQWAILNECAYSAAYAIASACDRITVPRTGGTGSIGVVCAHVDWSKALNGAGITVKFFQHGARKTDGASEKPLDDEAETRFQADIDTLGALFDDTAARNRDIAVSKIRAMEATTFLGAAGVTAGLADAVLAPDAAFRELLDSLA